MKCINKSFMAAIMVAATASVSAAWAQSDSIFFSTSGNLSASMTTLTGGSSTPGNITTSYSSLGQDTLYVWVTSIDNGGIGANYDITPPDTSYSTAYDSNGNELTHPFVPNSSASIAVNYSITSGTSFVNFSGSSTDGAAIYNNKLVGNNTGLGVTDPNGLTTHTMGDPNGVGTYTTVWDSASSYTYGAGPSTTQQNVTATSITNVAASAVPTADSSTITPASPPGQTITPTNIPRGLFLPSSSQFSTNPSTPAGPTGYVQNPQYNATANAFLLGTVTFSAAANGTAVIQIQKSDPTAGGLGIVRGGDGVVGNNPTSSTGDLTSPTTGNAMNGYSYYKATITVNAVATYRNGNLTGDSGLNTPITTDVVNAMDINQIWSDYNNHLTYVAANAGNGRRDDVLPGDVYATGSVTLADVQHEIGSLVDTTNFGMASGTHPGDANLDGFVDAGDLSIFRSNVGSPISGPSWQLADFNGDGFVDAGDLSIFRSYVGSPGGGDGMFAPVPEPGTFVLLGLGGLAGLLIKRRHAV
ncbi:MAG TPA: dockerin type I domain-containing protein [Pirellulales bacterium]|nr:dockerin type I domain-containing protein [Pirellulales bacterium]